jgi:hypothetical protein
VPFGCSAGVVIPRELRLSHGPRSEDGIIIGYNFSAPNGYYILKVSNNRVVTRFDVRPHPDRFPGSAGSKISERQATGFGTVYMMGPCAVEQHGSSEAKKTCGSSLF